MSVTVLGQEVLVHKDIPLNIKVESWKPDSKKDKHKKKTTLKPGSPSS